MRPTISCPSISEVPGNTRMPRVALGPFPDEYFLSGVDKVLDFCGVKNVCQLVEKLPFSSDFYLTSSNSDLDACCRRSTESSNQWSFKTCKQDPEKGLSKSPRGDGKLVAFHDMNSHLKNLPRLIGTKWAMAKVNIFDDCSRTYEILEIKGRLPPSVIPCKTAIIFAVAPDGSTICFDYIKPRK